MTIIARQATPGKWADASTPLTASVCAAVKAAGIVGVVRYVALPGNKRTSDIQAAELATVCDAGLECMLVQHVRFPPWLPGSQDGYEDGHEAFAQAINAGYPDGCHLWLDLEGAKGAAQGVARYVDDWGTAVKGTYSAGLYVGYDAVLSPDDLYARPDYDAYWSDAGHQHVATRGVCLSQGSTLMIAGVKFDADIMMADLLGGLPFACVKQPA